MSTEVTADETATPTPEEPGRIVRVFQAVVRGQMPDASLKTIDKQLRLSQRYYNRLIERHRELFAIYKKTLASSSVELAELIKQQEVNEEAITAEIARLRQLNAAARSRTASIGEDGELRRLKERRTELYTQFKELRKTVVDSEEFRTALANAQSTVITEREIYNLPEFSQLYWSFKNDLRDRASDANVSSLRVTGQPAFFARSNQINSLFWQIQKNPTWGDAITGGITLLSVGGGPFPEDFDNGQPGCRKRLTTAEKLRSVRIYCGKEPKVAGPKSKPKAIYIDFGASFQRRIPYDAQLKGMRLMQKKVTRWQRADGTWYQRYKFRIVLTVSLPAPEVIPTPCNAVAIDPGYRLMEDGSLRVAVALGDDGAEYELRLPQYVTNRYAVVAPGLRSTRSLMFNEAREKVAEYVARETTPEDVKALFPHLTQWRSAERFAQALEDWMKLLRLPEQSIEDWIAKSDDPPLYDFIFSRERSLSPERSFKGYLKQAWHLQSYEVGIDRHTQASRTARYREWVSMLTKKYRTIIFESGDLAAMAKKPEIGEIVPFVPQSFRGLAANATLGIFFKQKAQDYKPYPAALGATKHCSYCGTAQPTDSATSAAIVQQCCHCGRSWDIDFNAVRNMLHNYTHVKEEDFKTTKVNKLKGVKRSRIRRAPKSEAPSPDTESI